MVDVFLGLGSNVGDRLRYLGTAIVRLGQLPDTTVHTVSHVYSTDPVGVEEQDEFLNAAAFLSTGLTLTEFHAAIKRLEREIGRKRGPKWGPREIDIDILLYGAAAEGIPGVIVPHPELPNRNFVLEPLAEIGGERVHPELQVTMRTLRDQCSDRHGVRNEDTLTEQLRTIIKEISCSSITQTSAI